MTIQAEIFDALLASNTEDAHIDLCLAAFDGADKVNEVLAGAPGTSSVTRPTPVLTQTAVASDGVFLTAIEVRGFRGIGPLSELKLQPGPSLTFVTGRNGSGKSSFAEALEVVLTETVSRFGRSAVWKNGWRNIHTDEPAMVRLRCLIPVGEKSGEQQRAGQRGDTIIERNWEGSDLDTGKTFTQRPSASKSAFELLGWGPALTAVKPLLTNGELETLLGSDKPTVLHDRLGLVLGLDEVELAIALLNDEVKVRAAETRAIEAERKRLTSQLAATDDSRAEVASKVLTPAQLKKPASLATLRSLGEQTLDEDEDVAHLRSLLTVQSIDLNKVANSAAAALELADQLVGADTLDARASGELVKVLDAALAFHRTGGVAHDCPVCQSAGVLDDDWHSRAGVLRDTAANQSARLRDVQTSIRSFVNEVGTMGSIPSAILAASPEEHSELQEAWQAWAAVSQIVGSAESLTAYATEVEAAAITADRLRAEHQERAQRLLDERDANWKPLRKPLSDFVQRYEANATSAEHEVRLKGAVKALEVATTTVRNGRLAPVRDKARRYWELMRQSSSVSLQDIRLEGAGRARKVSFDVAIDNSSGQALGVMSQGELNALALSVFLPRATSVESPFRFVVIDDPVQAMDPAKVDGLARVLHEVASTHQVVVFTHDQRLIDAAENLGFASTVLAVERSEQSAVTVVQRSDEATRLLASAKTMAMATDASEEVRRRVVPHLCRQALESVLTSKYRRARLRDGLHPDDVENVLREAHGVHPLAALALGVPAAEVYSTINRKFSSQAADLFKRVKDEGHSGAANVSGLVDMVHDCQRFVEQVRN
jgi:energy-coupling factor transporter ATP-binding protein EcfA2